MKILFIGDIVGRAGRSAVKELLPKLRKKYAPDLVLANGENLSGGKGMSQKTYKEMRDCGIEGFTSGNHIWDNPDIFPLLSLTQEPILRPANFPEGNPGVGHRLFSVGREKLLVINVIGQVFMAQHVDSPFLCVEKILKEYHGKRLAGIFVDFHAETTSEKQAMFEYLRGRVSAVVGTHTHVQTNDARISPEGTAFMADVGACYPLNSLIGAVTKKVMTRFLKQMPSPIEIETEGDVLFNAVLLEIDPKTSRTISIEPMKEIVKR